MNIGLNAFEPEIERALQNDRTIDIVTTGAKTGLQRTTEIWFTRVDERIIICGTPGANGDAGAPRQRRDWLANLKANPDFWFCFKESLQYCVRARAREVTDRIDRYHIMSAPGTRWYRERVGSVDVLVDFSPIVEVFFEQSSR